MGAARFPLPENAPPYAGVPGVARLLLRARVYATERDADAIDALLEAARLFVRAEERRDAR
jgi:hypothetical protein